MDVFLITPLPGIKTLISGVLELSALKRPCSVTASRQQQLTVAKLILDKEQHLQICSQQLMQGPMYPNTPTRSSRIWQCDFVNNDHDIFLDKEPSFQIDQNNFTYYEPNALFCTRTNNFY